jgi:hypothetical protein
VRFLLGCVETMCSAVAFICACVCSNHILLPKHVRSIQPRPYYTHTHAKSAIYMGKKNSFFPPPAAGPESKHLSSGSRKASTLQVVCPSAPITVTSPARVLRVLYKLCTTYGLYPYTKS